RDRNVTGVQTCALPISASAGRPRPEGLTAPGEISPGRDQPRAGSVLIGGTGDEECELLGAVHRVDVEGGADPGTVAAADGAHERSEERRGGEEGRGGGA